MSVINTPPNIGDARKSGLEQMISPAGPEIT